MQSVAPLVVVFATEKKTTDLNGFAVPIISFFYEMSEKVDCALHSSVPILSLVL